MDHSILDQVNDEIAKGIRMICSYSDLTVVRGDTRIPIVSAIRNKELAGSLVEIGWRSLGAGSPGIFDIEGVDRDPFMALVLFDYALSVSPRNDGEDHTISMGAAIAHASRLSSISEAPGIDQDLITMIGQEAQRHLIEIEARQRLEADGRTIQGADQ